MDILVFVFRMYISNDSSCNANYNQYVASLCRQLRIYPIQSISIYDIINIKIFHEIFTITTENHEFEKLRPFQDLVTLGLCLPASCSIGDVATMLDKVFRNETLFIGKLFNIHFQLIEVSDLVDDHQWLLSAKMISIMYVNFKLLIENSNFYLARYILHTSRYASDKIPPMNFKILITEEFCYHCVLP